VIKFLQKEETDMILAIEIGNTYTVLGCIRDSKILFTERVSTKITYTDFEYAVKLKSMFEINGINPEEIEGTIISSVVPPMVEIIKAAVNKLIAKPIKIVGPGLKSGINIKMDNPGAVGADLIANAAGGLKKYKAPLIIVFMGTATTISVIDEKGCYIGGTIMAGLDLSLEALVHHTAQLPQIRLKGTDRVIGHNTVECLQSGTVIGAAASIDGLIERMEKELGVSTTHIITGIHAGKIMPYLKEPAVLDEELSMIGLEAIFYKNK